MGVHELICLTSCCYKNTSENPLIGSRCSDADPLLGTPHQVSRKRKTSASSPMMKKSPKGNNRLGLLVLKDTAESTRDLPSPGSTHQKLYIEKWLETCPEPRTLRSPEELVSCDKNGVKLEKFVMMQVFMRESLLNSELIALPDDNNTEICISHVPSTQAHSDTSDFRSFQFQVFPENPSYCEQFNRQFGSGIRIFCRQGKLVSIQKSTCLKAFYGTLSTPDWVQLSDTTTWNPVYDFQAVKQEKTVRDLGQFNPKTACPLNVVRIAVGCQPHPHKIYETPFHVKLSFVIH